MHKETMTELAHILNRTLLDLFENEPSFVLLVRPLEAATCYSLTNLPEEQARALHPHLREAADAMQNTR